MDTPDRITPRQAAYRDLCAIIARMSGRSRRAQRSLLETELAHALERAYDFQERCAELSARVVSQQDRVLGAELEIAIARGEARERVEHVRHEVLAVAEACVRFEALCELFLGATKELAAVEPPPLVGATPPRGGTVVDADDVDEEAVTERVPGSQSWPSRAKP
jgi:hypothetical protein